MALAASQSSVAIAQQSNCTTSSPVSLAYSIKLCITAPADGATIVGLNTVTTSITWTGSPHPIVNKLVFYLDSEYVATAFEPPFTFTLPSQYFVDGTRNLSVTASLSDGFATNPSAISLTLNNGTTQTPINNTPFTPYVPSSPHQPMIVAATGDGASAENPGVTNRIASWNPDLFLYLGDVYEKGTYTEFYNWYGMGANFFGQFRNITNPVIGNHEYENGSAPGYFYYWGAIPNYYSYDAGGWHFIALNSTSEANLTAPGSAQYQWLVQDLANSNALCTIAYFHHPLYNIGPEGESSRMSYIWDLLSLKGVDVVLNGHDHNYQHWKPLDLNGNLKSDGITEFVAGGGGHGTQTFIRTDPRILYATDVPGTAFGALKLQLGSNSMTFDYINEVGTVLDTGNIPCHPAPVDTTPPTTPSNLTASISNIGHVVLQWAASTDATRVNGYTIYRDGSALTTVSGQTLSYTDTTTAGNTLYTYTVDAYDMDNNHSALSIPASITTPKITTSTVPITIDSYVTDASPGTNFGTNQLLRVDATPVQHSYLRFDVPALTGNVITATLQVYATSANTTGYTVYNTSGGWGETTINFSNAPALGSSINSSGPFPINSWSSVDITPLVTGSGQYNIVMATSSTTGAVFSSSEGTNAPKVVVRASGLPPPSNDDFSNNITISALPYSNPQTTESATVQSGEQAASCEGSANIKNTVWYTYTATANQQVTFSATGSSVVKGISVWTGSALGALTEVGCAIPGGDTADKVNVTNGTLYYIRIGSNNGFNSDFTLQAAAAPVNDDFANAVTIDAISTNFAPFTDTQNVVGASIQTNEPVATCGSTPAFRTVWYVYTALDQHIMILDTTGSDYNTTLSVWTGNGLGALTQIGCNDNNGALTTSALTVNAVPGATYFIRVSSSSGTAGNLKFNAFIASKTGAAPLRNYFTTATPTLTWNRVTGATRYIVQVSKSSTFAGTLPYTASVPANQLSVTTNPLTEGIYYWRVSANNGVTWSAVDSFIVDLP